MFLVGGTKEERDDIVKYYWEERKRFIPDEYSLITKKIVYCSGKSNVELEKRIFFKAEQKIKESIKDSVVLTHYKEVETGIKMAKTYINRKIRDYVKNYTKVETGICDVSDTVDIRPEMMEGAQVAFYRVYKKVLDTMKRYNNELKKVFLSDLLDKFKPLPQCNILILSDISYSNIPLVCRKLEIESRKKQPMYIPDIIIALTEKNENVEELDESFKKRFEIIDLSEKKKSSKTVDSKTIASGPSPLIVPKGTKWADIEMFFIDVVKETIDISISGKTPFTKGYWDLGLKHKQAKKTVLAWEVLKEFAKSEDNVIPVNKVKFEQIKNLRDALNTSFGIPDDPIPYCDKEGYKTLFRIKDTSYTEEYKESAQKKEDVTCSECDELIKNYTYKHVNDKGDYICHTCMSKEKSHDKSSSGPIKDEPLDSDDEWD